MASVGPLVPLRGLAPLVALVALASACEPRRIRGAETPVCLRCHGFPPDTGAHLAHARPPPGTFAVDLHLAEDDGPLAAGYDFGCAHCHPAIDPGAHVSMPGGTASDPVRRVVLAPPDPAVPGDRLKARNHPDAAYDPASGTCAGVYCHSSGQEAPSFDRDGDLALDRTPPWRRDPALGPLDCDGCHGNPPRYPSGGAGAPDANSHLVLADDGWESGHFQGMPGPWHTSKHGGNWTDPPRPTENDAAPITCQACHADSVDPGAAGPSGFYWLDTTGDYQLPGGDPGRLASPIYARLQCTACHDGAAAVAGAGRMLPLRHVNGRRDVAFDARTVLPALSWLPASPSTPTRPYWVTNAAPGVTFPDPAIPDAFLQGTTLSAHLASARYDAATKTCASVACHLAQTEVTWGAPHGFAACSACHPL